MKLRNKKTGKIVDATMSYREGTAPIVVSETTCDENGQSQGWPYNSLAELIEEWEDYEEPKEYWTVDCGMAIKYTWNGEKHDRAAEAVGLKFDTKEECERAIEKMKAWKRLKDNGFKFKRWEIIDGRIDFMILPKREYREKVYDDLGMLFGGEE